MAFRPSSLRQVCLVLVTAVALAWVIVHRPRLSVPASGKSVAEAARPRSAEPVLREIARDKADYRVTMEQLRSGRIPRLSRAEVDAYLAKQGRSAGSLLVGYRFCQDLALLREAAKVAPEDSAVQLELSLRGENLEERSAAVEAFRKSSPGNSLGDYLAVHVSFEKGDFVGAAGALLSSLGSDTLADYSQQIARGAEEAYADAGYDPVAAKVAATALLVSDRQPQVEAMRNVGQGLGQLRDELIKVGDFEAVEPTVLAGQTLGQRLNEQSPYLIDQMVGIGIEKSFLEQLDPETLVGANGATVATRLAEIDARSTEIRDLVQTAQSIVNLPSAQADRYVDIARRDGELAALRWLKSQAK